MPGRSLPGVCDYAGIRFVAILRWPWPAGEGGEGGSKALTRVLGTEIGLLG